MARAMVALLVFVGGNAFAVYLQNQKVPDWIWLTVSGLAFAAAAIIEWWPRWKRAWSGFWRIDTRDAPIKGGQPESSIESDARLAMELFEDARWAITFRDEKVRSASGLFEFVRVQRDYGRWYGRNCYRAEQVQSRFPAEVQKFMVHGANDLHWVVSVDEHKTQLNQLAALITVRADALTKLATAIHASAVARR